jgi:hypothetical protein
MATRVDSPHAGRSRNFASADGFNIKRPRIPAHGFSYA